MKKKQKRSKKTSEECPEELFPTQTFFICGDVDKLVYMNCLNNELKAVQVPGLGQLAFEGFYYVVTFEGRLFLSGGMRYEGTLHEAIWSGDNSMDLKKLHPMITARHAHQMTLFAAGKCLMVTGGIYPGTYE